MGPPRGSTGVAAGLEVTVDLDRWDVLAGFDLVPRGGETVFKVGTELLRSGGRAVEDAVDAGFPAGTELEYRDGAWVVVLPYDRDDELEAETGPVELDPPPGYAWAELDGRPVLRLVSEADPNRPAFHPPGGRTGWRWRPAGELGWVLQPPAGLAPEPVRARRPALPPAPRPAPERPASALPAHAVPAAPATAPPRVRQPAPERASTPVRRPSPSRRGRLLDVVGIVLIAIGLGVAGVLLLSRGGGGGDAPPEAADLATLLGVAPADLLAAVNLHDPGELPTSIAPPSDPMAGMVATALVLVDLDAGEAARLAESLSGAPGPGQHLVMLIELVGDEPAPDAEYRYALLDATRPVVRIPEGDDADGTARVDLRRAYYFEPAAGRVTAVGYPDLTEVPTGAFAARAGRYVMIGVPRDELTGGAVFGHALVRPAGTGPVGYTFSPPYQFG